MSVSEPLFQASDSQNSLILDSLEVKNFRAFRHLTIEKLGRVNLITGKNNVGKSSLLEAISLYSGSANPALIQQLLEARSELNLKSGSEEVPDLGTSSARSRISDPPYSNIRYIFYGREDVDNNNASFSVGSLNDISKTLEANIRWYKTTEQVYEDSEGESQIRRIVVPMESHENEISEDSTLFFAVRRGKQKEQRYRAERMFSRLSSRNNNELPVIPHQYVRSAGLNASQIGTLWDSITATDEEKDVLSALRLVTPLLERVVLVGDEERYRDGQWRVPLVKLVGVERVPMRSLGDGMNRLFGVALSLVSARGGVLLIDEIETGVHYSVIADVWRLIFQTARRLNVQVFATTHSWDCIEAFQQAASEDEADGALIRLQNKNGDVVATVFDEEDLAVVTREGIEVR